MGKLNRIQALELHGALCVKGLKTKHISGANYLNLLKLKTILKNEIWNLQTAEQDLFTDTGAVLYEDGYRCANHEDTTHMLKRLSELQKAFYVNVGELNFIPAIELKEYAKDQDTSVEAILFEYLMKDE